MEAIKTQVVDGMILFSIKSLKSLGQMGESQMGQVLAKMSLEDPKIESLTAPQRTLMNQIFIHQNIVGLYLLSEIGGIMAAGTSMAFGWQSGTGIDAMKQTWATLRGQVPEALKKARNIAIAVGDEKILSHLTDTLTPGSQHSAWQLFEEFEIKTLVGHAAKSAKTQGALIEALTVLKGQYTSKITTQIIGEALSGATKASGLADAATALENTIRSAHVGSPRGWFQNMGDRVKGSLSRDAKYMGTHFDDANHVLRQQMNLVADGVKYRESMFGTGWTKLRTALQMKEGQFAAAIQKGTIPLHLKDADNFIPAMQQLSHESPDLVRAFFRNFALGIVVGTTATAGE